MLLPITPFSFKVSIYLQFICWFCPASHWISLCY